MAQSRFFGLLKKFPYSKLVDSSQKYFFNSYGATGNRTHVSRVALKSRDFLKDALRTEVHGRGTNILYNILHCKVSSNIIWFRGLGSDLVQIVFDVFFQKSFG